MGSESGSRNRRINSLPFLVLDLSLDVVNGVGRLDLKGDGLAGECLNEDLHGSVMATRKSLE